MRRSGLAAAVAITPSVGSLAKVVHCATLSDGSLEWTDLEQLRLAAFARRHGPPSASVRDAARRGLALGAASELTAFEAVRDAAAEVLLSLPTTANEDAGTLKDAEERWARTEAPAPSGSEEHAADGSLREWCEGLEANEGEEANVSGGTDARPPPLVEPDSNALLALRWWGDPRASDRIHARARSEPPRTIAERRVEATPLSNPSRVTFAT